MVSYTRSMYEDSYLDNYYEDRLPVDENGFYAANVDEGTWDEYDEYEYVEEADYEDYEPNVYDGTYSEA